MFFGNGGGSEFFKKQETLGIVVISCFLSVSREAILIEEFDEGNLLKELFGGGGINSLAVEICGRITKISTSKSDFDIFNGIAQWQVGNAWLTIGGYKISPRQEGEAEFPLIINFWHVCRYGD